MKSLRELYRIGQGPSSSHTMGPRRAAEQYKQRHPEAKSFRVTLYGSLAATGKGHLTDWAILQVLGNENTEIVWKADTVLPFHPNGMRFEVKMADGSLADPWTVFSVGGGALAVEGETQPESPDIYPLNHLGEIKHWCEEHGMAYWEYVQHCEGEGIWDYLEEVWRTMCAAVERGIEHEGVLPGELKLRRKAPDYYIRAMGYGSNLQSRGLVFAYALAVSEENASGGTIVTAPTCGACGVLPAVLKYMQEKNGFSEEDILRALAVGGLIGNLVKHNASISGAECGCQAEIGTACSMASAALAELFEMGIDQIEYAAEMAMEHYLGLTCDPICGLVQIPCIERNAVAAMRAINALSLANFLSGTRKISFDVVVRTMYQTGRDMSSKYRETADGGLAAMYR